MLRSDEDQAAGSDNKNFNVRLPNSQNDNGSSSHSSIVRLSEARAVKRNNADQVFGFIETLATAAGLAAGTMAAVAVGTVVLGAFVAAHCIRAGFEEFNREFSNTDAARFRESRENEIREINSEIVGLESKLWMDGRLSDYDRHALDNLYRRRKSQFSLLENANGLVMANEVSRKTGEFDNMHVSDINAHVLQYHAGQSVFGKTCRNCGMPMTLQWQQSIDVARMSDFFWACTGFYDRKCRNVERFVRTDMDLFTNTGREEFSIGNSKFNSIVHMPQSTKLVRRRMNELISLPNSTYYCPVHHEPMVLRTKKGAETVRDMYFYGCPRWRPNGPSCSQIVKLKSAAQLTAALETMTGKGIL